MSDSIRVNGNQLSWGSITLKVLGEAFTGFTAISYSDKRERVKAYGMGRAQAPRGRSRGKYTADNAKITGWKDSVSALREFLASKSDNGANYGDVTFQIVIQYVEDDETPQTVELCDCVWAANNTSEDESPDPLKEDFEADVMFIRRNGMTLYDNSDGLR